MFLLVYRQVHHNRNAYTAWVFLQRCGWKASIQMMSLWLQEQAAYKYLHHRLGFQDSLRIAIRRQSIILVA